MYVAVDCEMVGVGPMGRESVLGRLILFSLLVQVDHYVLLQGGFKETHRALEIEGSFSVLDVWCYYPYLYRPVTICGLYGQYNAGLFQFPNTVLSWYPI